MISTTYRLDKTLRIVGVGGDWERFAAENDGVGLDPEAVVGTHLLSWISGDQTKMWVEIAFQALFVREQITKQYRCDSDQIRREMEMSACWDADGNIEVENRIIRALRQSNVVSISADRHLGSVPALRCSVCNSIRRDGKWFDPFDIERDQSYTVIHTVCDNCSWLAQADGTHG